MTIREKALSILIDAEANKIWTTLKERLEQRLDELNNDMKRFPSEEIQKDYAETATRLTKLRRSDRNSLLDIDCDTVNVPYIF
jgi:hemerythrin-like domain-containing protein